ncbi:hypothetical protein FOL47_007619 [Perkinsus chesapeaki]|uniref:DUF7164 domain-containing protein n=1 Tax=Perkinsus chesapeaki TaxID=330153 RepID=A0A7J6LJ73_PERCH|nr:hypothetical protein FOL47_007619 [Perkinsus chesapeaki]
MIVSGLFALLGTASLLCILFQTCHWSAIYTYEKSFRGLSFRPNEAVITSAEANSNSSNLSQRRSLPGIVLIPDNRSKISYMLESITSAEYWKLQQGRDILKSQVADAAAHLDDTVAQLAGLNSLHSNITTTRAVMAYMPTTAPPRFQRELRALYLSWLLVLVKEPVDIRTDLVIFTSARGQQVAEEIGCTSMPRSDASETGRCILIKYTPLQDRQLYSKEPSDPLLEYTSYIDCMLTMSEYNGFEYDYALRTDLDTFLMPGFTDWLPIGRTQLIVGWGGYASKNANLHLQYVAQTLGLRSAQGLTSLGSTWYGNLKLFRATANLTLTIIRWLLTQEFSEFEKCCSRAESWPHWHRAVALLYGGHVALNHISNNVAAFGADQGFMDFQSVKKDPITNTKIKHVHCWHTREMFSKFKFHEGEYDQLDLTPYANMSTTRDYVITVAVSSIRLSNDELARLATDMTLLRKRESWLRLESNAIAKYI